jgi:5-methylphenazine-1-carboxylate 1-monooxygenase
MRIAIAGGGICGMTLALSLHAVGITDVDIYEASSGIKELGVGINVLPHAARELTELGLLDALDAVAIRTAELAYYSRHGQRIWSEPRGLAAGYHWPQFSIHRGELLGLLYRAVVDRLGAHRIHAGHRLERDIVKTHGAGLLVGCDGVHSVVRAAFYPDEGPPKWNGITMWRAVTEGEPFLGGRTMLMAGHVARRVVAYPISRTHEARGRALINWVAEFRNAAAGMPPQDWEHTAKLDDVLEPFTGYRFDFLDVPAMIRGAKTIYQYPMVDRDPLPTWNFGRVTLLGDAAHPMYPVGSNGASQAIIDARVLARELALQPSIEKAVEAYDAQRRPATANVVLANRQVGPERCMEIVEQRAPDGFATLDDVISRAELEEIAAAYKRTAGFAPDALNSRPSLSVPDPT